MASKTLRMFICAAVAAALGMFGTGAQATDYGVVFDPPTIIGHFTGDALLDVSDTCRATNCVINLLRANIFDSGTFGSGWFSNGQPNISVGNVIADGPLIAFDSVLIPLSLFNPTTAILFTNAIPCRPSLKFTSAFPPNGDFLGHSGYIADIECFDNAKQENVGDNAVYTLTQLPTTVPEPGTLALILGGVGAAWLMRQRKAAS